MALTARQKVNASACSAKDISASLNWKNKHTRDSVVVFTRTVKKAEELGKEKALWWELDSTGVTLSFPSQLELGEG